jgi:rSAM/selenodomain-associated transferase 2
MREQSMTIIIPTLNAAASLGLTLEACAEAGAPILVVDGGSADATTSIARACGAAVIAAPRGRGLQLAIGAGEATTTWLLFLHADTQPAPGWWNAVLRACPSPERAWYFHFALHDNRPAARRLERLVAWRCRVLALPYGDQGLLIARSLYDEIGGFRHLPLMEDVDLVRRLGRKRLAVLPTVAVTSAERWQREGWWRRSTRNLICLTLWFLGVPAATIKRLYG